MAPRRGRDRLEEALFCKRLGQVLVRADHAPARPVEQAVLRRQHDHRRMLEFAVLLDERASLVAVQPRHHDIDEDHVRLVVRDLGQGVKAVLGEDHRAPRLQEEDLRAAAYGVRVVDHHDLDA